jgi:hypothetical protein
MTTQQQYIERLKGMVVLKFGRGIATAEDCVALSEAVAEVTDMQLDANDYVKLFIPQSNIAPRPVTLSALTRYVGYDSWSTFCSSSEVRPAEDSDIIPTPRRWGVFILTIVAIIVVVVTAIALLDGGKDDVVVVENADVVVAMVEERWLARTLEECNALRAYADEQNYSERIDAFMEEYCTTLYDEISSHIISDMQRHSISLTDDEVASYTNSIVVQCCTMCETLRMENDYQE